MTQFDHIIVGAGSAGCVLAHRLSADPGCQVLLIEAGPVDRGTWITMPAAFGYAIAGAHHNWGYESEPEEGLNDRNVPLPRGKVVGGSSSINAMVFVRGQREDYDDWATQGLPDWSARHCLPYFRKLESFHGPRSNFRGGNGPVQITQPKGLNVLDQAFLAASRQAGFPHNGDVNGADQEGFGPMDQTIFEGRRVSAASAYLRPIADRPNLTLLTGMPATRIVVQGSRAVGVELAEDAQTRFYGAAGEVLVCAGAANSPQLLMLSGIGPADALHGLGIPVTANLPGVGTNVQDHADVSVKHTCLKPVSVTPSLRFPHNGLLLARWLTFKSGRGATNHFETAGYIPSTPGCSRPDLQFCFMPLLVASDGSALSVPHGFQASVLGLRPRSRGTITLRSSDPRHAPIFRPNYFAEAEDRKELRNGIRALRGIFSQPALEPFRGAEISPGREVESDEELDGFIRRTAKSTHHLSCSCAMGTGDMSVVDQAARVYGVEGLRVIDASIFPSIPSGNINAPTLMVAEKLADAVLGKEPLAPEDWHRPPGCPSQANKPTPAG